MLKTILVIAALLHSAAPAEACSFSWARGRSPAEIRENPAMQRVTGTFRFELNPANGHIVTDARGRALGRIQSAGRRYWNTVQDPLHEVSIECGAYTAPTANGVTGTFWISRDRRDRRYRLMLWDWENPPAPPAARQP